MCDTVLHNHTKYKITILYIMTTGDEMLSEMNNKYNDDLYYIFKCFITHG